MRTCYEIIRGKLQIVSGHSASAPVILFINPDNLETKELLERFRTGEHTLSSALDPEEPSRFEPSEEGHLALIFKMPRNDSEEDRLRFKVSSIGLFLYPDRLIAVLPEEEPIFTDKMFGSVNSPEDALLNILLVSAHWYLAHLKIINEISEEIESKISVAMENRYLLDLFSLEKSLVYYLNALDSDGMVLDRLKIFAEKNGFSGTNQALLEDIIIENVQARRQAEIYTEVLSNIMDARVSIVNNNLSIHMKALSFITIMIMVPTFIVSVFSMNVSLPFQHYPQAFWLVLLISSLSLSAFLIWWRVAVQKTKGLQSV